ncbi:TetR/AcrR family transcriptional regulator [Guptibacillus hwajinpoensis]|uniref:TetR/AcrR family transcriptional regulator n=1 Tax=Guptibacillus hwajinpoensis TaxID=208199 RepID=UPI001CFD7773|nr:TetR/AcrR family transcriptional regulator [Pseudalkalibacillus hwajinpoensis]WLR61463.1 helix-turn-helix domain-containing protein [Pseudalkalibacillus hwajinpoensis]
MSGLREQKKQETRKKIMEVAKGLFLEKGYEATSTELVARRAGIGSGTLFNYFPSKAELLVEVMRAEFLSMEERADLSFEVQERAEATVRNYLTKRLEGFSLLEKKLFRELIVASLNAYQSKPEFLQSLMQLDFMFIEELVELLKEIRRLGKLPDNFEVEIAAELIYSSVMFETLIYLYQEERSLEEVLEQTGRKLTFILK